MYPVILNIGSITIYTFGIFALLSFVFGSFLVWKQATEAHISEEEIFDTIVIVTLSGLFGARTVYVLLNFERFGLEPLKWLSIFQISGLSFIGGIIAGFIALWLVSRVRRWEFFSISDIGVTGLCLAQAIGWVGAFFSGFGVGKQTEILGIRFIGYESPRFPVQIVVFVCFFILSYLLWQWEARYRTFEWYKGKRAAARSGFLTFVYLIGFGLISVVVALLADFSVYFFRIPVDLIFGLLFIVIGGVGVYIRSGRELVGDKEKLGYFVESIKKRLFLFVKGKGKLIARRARREDKFRSRPVRQADLSVQKGIFRDPSVRERQKSSPVDSKSRYSLEKSKVDKRIKKRKKKGGLR